MGSEATETRTGETLEGRYRLDRYVGDDGSADVYEGTDTQAGSAVTVRMLRPEFALQQKAFEGFVALPKALLGVSPPHMARVFAVMSDDTGIPFVVEESSSGHTLAELLIEHSNGLPLPDACRLLAPLIEACARLHLAGVVHGSIEPGRVMLVNDALETTPRIVHYSTGVRVKGRRAEYLAPEQRDGSAVRDVAADVWALGALMHHAFTGRAPSIHASEREPLWAGLPSNIASALRDSLCADPRERVPDAAVLWMRLEGAFAQAALPATKVVAKAEAPVVKPTPASAATLVIPREPAPAAEVPVVKPTPASAATLVIPREVAPGVETPAAKIAPPPQAVMARALAPLEPEVGAIGAVAEPGVTRVQKSTPKRVVPQPPQAQRPQADGRPGGLSDAQIKGLLNLGNDREHAAWAWIRIVLLLLLLLLLYEVVPFVAEPDLATARRVFGPRLKIVGIALMSIMVVAMARTWAVSAKANSLLMRPVVYSFQVVVLCVCVLLGGALVFGDLDVAVVGAPVTHAAGGAVWRGVSGMARTLLPYGVTLLLLFGAAFGLMQGLKSLRQSMAVAIATLLLAAGGGAGAVQMTVKTVKAAVLRAKEDAAGQRDKDPDGLSVDRIKESLTHKQIDLGNMPAPAAGGAEPKVQERTSIGGGDDEKLILEDMGRQRAHQQDVIKAAEKELPPPPH